MNSYSRTYETNPELWDDGLSFLAKFEYADGSQNVLASGWHLRQIEFENQTVHFDAHSTHEVGFLSVGESKVTRENAWSNIKKFEIEIALDAHHTEDAIVMLSGLLKPETAKSIIESMFAMNKRVSANRSDHILIDDFGNEIETIDLLCQNMPARSGNVEEPLRALSRWCRIFSLLTGTITIYQPLDANALANLRWPHNCIYLNRGADYYLTNTEVGSIETAFEIPIKYEAYNLANWRMEFEVWENQPLQIMIDDNPDNASKRFSKAQQDLGVLSKFITDSFLVARNLDRRVSNNRLIQSNERLQTIAKAHLKEQQQKIQDYRGLLREASGLLANTAQSIQAIANQQSAEATERTNTFLTYASAVFFIPTLIISFFSMSIIGLDNNDVVPSMLFVLALCMLSVGVAILS